MTESTPTSSVQAHQAQAQVQAQMQAQMQQAQAQMHAFPAGMVPVVTVDANGLPIVVQAQQEAQMIMNNQFIPIGNPYFNPHAAALAGHQHQHQHPLAAQRAVASATSSPSQAPAASSSSSSSSQRASKKSVASKKRKKKDKGDGPSSKKRRKTKKEKKDKKDKKDVKKHHSSKREKDASSSSSSLLQKGSKQLSASASASGHGAAGGGFKGSSSSSSSSHSDRKNGGRGGQRKAHLASSGGAGAAAAGSSELRASGGSSRRDEKHARGGGGGGDRKARTIASPPLISSSSGPPGGGGVMPPALSIPGGLPLFVDSYRLEHGEQELTEDEQEVQRAASAEVRRLGSEDVAAATLVGGPSHFVGGEASSAAALPPQDNSRDLAAPRPKSELRRLLDSQLDDMTALGLIDASLGDIQGNISGGHLVRTNADLEVETTAGGGLHLGRAEASFFALADEQFETASFERRAQIEGGAATRSIAELRDAAELQQKAMRSLRSKIATAELRLAELHQKEKTSELAANFSVLSSWLRIPTDISAELNR